ncbi:MAG: hypothetical protein ACREYF_15935 [Gammaproteobacteria bacterium]
MDPSEHWEQVLREPALRDLPYKIETNRYGQIIMTRTSRCILAIKG